jgi:AcrR family transcriptional regulator
MAARRSSYGPTSPVVGERGARTRQLVVDVTLELLAKRGYHAMLVDDIARAAGVSRATLYQYFESKEQIFIELLEECGGALQRVGRRLGPLGPTPEGFDNLHWWLGEWSWVYDKYDTLFMQWAAVDSPQAPLRPYIARFEEIYIGRLADRFRQAGVVGVDHDAIAVCMLAVVEQCNYHRRTSIIGVDDNGLVDALAVVLQLVLFPTTPGQVLRHRPQSALPSPPSPPARQARSQAVELSVLDDRFGSRSARARATIGQLLDAGSRVFAANGFHGANVDQIVTEAGVARGTFYKYFDDKLDLLTVLADECAGLTRDMSRRFDGLESRPAALRAWLAEFVGVHRRHAGVFRAWLEPEPRRHLGANGLVPSAFVTRFRDIERAYALDERAAALILVALLERVPDEASGTRYHLTDEEATEAMASFIERGLFNRVNRGHHKVASTGRAPVL